MLPLVGRRNSAGCKVLQHRIQFGSQFMGFVARTSMCCKMFAWPTAASEPAACASKCSGVISTMGRNSMRAGSTPLMECAEVAKNSYCKYFKVWRQLSKISPLYSSRGGSLCEPTRYHQLFNSFRTQVHAVNLRLDSVPEFKLQAG